MRSGISHLSNRIESEERKDAFSVATAPETETPPVPACELDGPIWSVLSFDKREAGGLTDRQARALMTELNAHGIHGLCIITDDAAKRRRG